MHSSEWFTHKGTILWTFQQYGVSNFFIPAHRSIIDEHGQTIQVPVVEEACRRGRVVSCNRLLKLMHHLTRVPEQLLSQVAFTGTATMMIQTLLMVQLYVTVLPFPQCVHLLAKLSTLLVVSL
jgi:hypothetical protein